MLNSKNPYHARCQEMCDRAITEIISKIKTQYPDGMIPPQKLANLCESTLTPWLETLTVEESRYLIANFITTTVMEAHLMCLIKKGLF